MPLVSLDDQIDGLYQLPLSEFTAARNALAKSLGGDAAKAIKGLVKPTLVPWVVNQLYWQARPVYMRLLKSGAALREAQIATLTARRGAGDEARRAAEAHSKALEEAVGRVMQLATSAAERLANDDVKRMLETISMLATHPEKPGRLTVVVRPAGFEALAGVTPAGRGAEEVAAGDNTKPRVVSRTGDRAAGSSTSGRSGPARDDQARSDLLTAERARAEEQARRQHEADVKAATGVLDQALAAEARAKDAFERAYEALERAKDARRSAERALRQLKS